MEFDRNSIRYTIVQHSRCGYGGDETFKDFVEERIIMNQKELNKVVKSGGLIIDSYKEVDNWITNLGFNSKGKFSRSKIDGLKIFVPLLISIQ